VQRLMGVNTPGKENFGGSRPQSTPKCHVKEDSHGAGTDGQWQLLGAREGRTPSAEAARWSRKADRYPTVLSLLGAGWKGLASP
jgi:hypothetical protein